MPSLSAPVVATAQVDGGRGYSTETTDGPDGIPLLLGVFVTGMDHA